MSRNPGRTLGDTEEFHHFVGTRGFQLPDRHSRRGRINGRVVVDPSPPNPLRQRPTDDPVHSPDGRRRVGPRAPPTQEVPVEPVELDAVSFLACSPPIAGMIGASRYMRLVATVFGEKLGVA